MVGFSRERVTAELLALTLLSTFLHKPLGTGSSTVELSGLTVVLNNNVKHRNIIFMVGARNMEYSFGEEKWF